MQKTLCFIAFRANLENQTSKRAGSGANLESQTCKRAESGANLENQTDKRAGSGANLENQSSKRAGSGANPQKNTGLPSLLSAEPLGGPRGALGELWEALYTIDKLPINRTSGHYVKQLKI